jgi:hypothetical protein
LIFTFATIVAYKKYQEKRIPAALNLWNTKYKNSYYIKEYRRARKIATILTLILVIVFCKSVKNAT